MTTSHYRCDHIGCNARLPYFAVKESGWFIQKEHCLCATHRTRAHRYECECKKPVLHPAYFPPMCTICRRDARNLDQIRVKHPECGFSYNVIGKQLEKAKERLERDLDLRMFPLEQYPPAKIKLPPFYRHPPDSEKFGSIFDAMPYIAPVLKMGLPSWGMHFKCVEDNGPMLRFVPIITLGGVGYFCLECGHRDDNVVAHANCINSLPAKTCPKRCAS